MRLVVTLVLLLVPTRLVAGTATTPVEELQLMTMRELYERGVPFCLLDCTNVDISTPEYSAMIREMNNIRRVARQKNKGTFPKWVLRQQQAMKEGKLELCHSPEFK